MPEGGQIVRLKQGWLVKQGGRVKNWKRRFFVLDGTRRLTYYLSEADAQAGVHHLGIINLEKALYVKARASALKDTTIFWPSHIPPDCCFTIITGDRNYGIYSDLGAEDCKLWVESLQKVRGNVDKTDITLTGDDEAFGTRSGTVSSMRPRAATISQVQLDEHQVSLVKKYKMENVPPNVAAVFCKWHRLLENSLESLAQQFGTSPYTFECDMGELFERTAKLRTRLGELVFGDYIDELRYNVCKELGDEEVSKEVFVQATSQRRIQFDVVDEQLPENSPNRLSVKDGVLVMEVFSKRLGHGVHLMGKGFVHEFKALSSAEVCGGVVKGLPLADALNVCRAKVGLEQALTRLSRALSTGKFEFECDYQQVHEAAGKQWSEVRTHLGDAIIGNVVSELCTLVAGQAYAGKSSGLPGQLEALLSRRKIVFKLVDENVVKAEADDTGVLVVSTSIEKLHELTVYERTATFNLQSLLEDAANAGSSI